MDFVIYLYFGACYLVLEIAESAVSDAGRGFDLTLRSNRKLRKEIELLRDQLKS
jgi:hypothetical protein